MKLFQTKLITLNEVLNIENMTSKIRTEFHVYTLKSLIKKYLNCILEVYPDDQMELNELEAFLDDGQANYVNFSKLQNLIALFVDCLIDHEAIIDVMKLYNNENIINLYTFIYDKVLSKKGIEKIDAVLDESIVDKKYEEKLLINRLEGFSRSKKNSRDEDDLQIDKDKRIIPLRTNEQEVRSLHDKMKKGKLVTQPDFQRFYVWKSDIASRLIESVLIGIQMPNIYLSEEDDGTLEVIDGQQRLTTLFSFIGGKFPDGKDFKLSKLNIFSELNGKTFDKLDETNRDRILDYSLYVVTIQKEADKILKYEIFKRLNTGAVKLNPMELRNCIFRGPYMDLLREMAKNEYFIEIIGAEAKESRMRSIEFALRFSAFYHSSYLKYSSPMKKFLDQDMEDYRRLNELEQADLKTNFLYALDVIQQLFKENIFHRYTIGDEENPNGNWDKKRFFSASLFDVWMNGFLPFNRQVLKKGLEGVREGIIELLSSNLDFEKTTRIGTSVTTTVHKRFEMVRDVTTKAIDGILDNDNFFSLEKKERLFLKNDLCNRCNIRIHHIDDAVVTNRPKYWHAKSTFKDDDSFSHRYCEINHKR